MILSQTFWTADKDSFLANEIILHCQQQWLLRSCHRNVEYGFLLPFFSNNPDFCTEGNFLDKVHHIRLFLTSIHSTKDDQKSLTAPK